MVKIAGELGRTKVLKLTVEEKSGQEKQQRSSCIYAQFCLYAFGFR